jgi:hypothetical protein
MVGQVAVAEAHWLPTQHPPAAHVLFAQHAWPPAPHWMQLPLPPPVQMFAGSVQVRPGQQV